MAQATAITCDLLEQQAAYTKLLSSMLIQPPQKVALAEPIVRRQRTCTQPIGIPLTENKPDVIQDLSWTETLAAQGGIADVEHGGNLVKHDQPRAAKATNIFVEIAPAANPIALVSANRAAVRELVAGFDGSVADLGGEQLSVKQRIRERAYALWEAEGRPEGKPLESWSQAEREVHSLLHVGGSFGD